MRKSLLVVLYILSQNRDLDEEIMGVILPVSGHNVMPDCCMLGIIVVNLGLFPHLKIAITPRRS